MPLINNFCLFLQFKLRGLKAINAINGLKGSAEKLSLNEL